MRKRLYPLVAALLLTALGAAVSLAAAASSSDPLISLSYLTDTFLPSLNQQAEQRLDVLDETAQTARDQLDEKADAYLAQASGGDAALSYSAGFTDTAFRRGDTLSLSSGAGFLLRAGSAKVTHDGTVVDVTTGSTVASGTALTANHRYLVGEETSARFYLSSEAAVAGVEGYYTLTPSTYNTMPFLDVSEDDWFHAAVTYAYGKGLFSGTAADTFSPNMNITRGMVVTVLYQLAGRPAVSGTGGFTDVPADAYYATPVAWATANGVVAGMGDNQFAPSSNITREQLACMLYSYARNIAGLDCAQRGDLSRYHDRDSVASYATEALSWAVGAGIITGIDDTTLSPKGTATRAQAAAMLYVMSSLS